MMRFILMAWTVLVLFCAAPASAQTLIKNPSGLIFTCPDHALDDQHEIDIVRQADGVVVQTLLVGDPPADVNGDVVVKVNVQPVAFGSYVFRVRAVAGTIKSDTSDPSPIWERAPGKPTNVQVQ